MMRTVLLVILMALSFGCQSGHADPSTRSATPTFKGVELYSWLDAPSQRWHFVLLPGTNRNKTSGEILGSKEVLRSVQELKSRLERLAPNESVFWLRVDTGPPSLPPQATIDDITRHAASVGVNLTHLFGNR